MEYLVSVVMSVYNAEKYLKESIESILNQTYENIEFIIINDGSMDSSLSIIKDYIKKDNRIILVDNIENKGLIYSLNKGIDIAKGKYIVRMDADDISLESRIEEQVKFMDNNGDIALSGTSNIIFFNKNKVINKKMNAIENYEDIKANSIFSCSFVHPSVIMRNDIIKKENFKYKEEFKHAEDFGLWCEIMSKYKVANINKPLLRYRVVKTSVTRQANKDMRQREDIFKRIYKMYLNNLGLEISERELDIHFEIAMIQNLKEYKFTLGDKLHYLKRLNEENFNFNIDRVIKNQYNKCCIYQGKYEDLKNDLIEIDINKFKFYKLNFIENTKKIVKEFVS